MGSKGADPERTNGESGAQTQPQRYAVTSVADYQGDKKRLRRTRHRHVWIVTGPAGCGKTTVASFIAGRYGMPYLEGDIFHPEANIAKMAAGQPLTDEDRWEWLARVRDAFVSTVTTTSSGAAAAPPSTSSSSPPSSSSAPSTSAIDPPTSSTGSNGTAALPRPSPFPSSCSSAYHPASTTAVVTCSALRKSYRDILRAVPPEAAIRVHFVYLALDEEVLFRRVRERVGHYMKESMVRSQIEALEEPDGGERERDTLVVRAGEEKWVVEAEVGRGLEEVMEGDAL